MLASSLILAATLLGSAAAQGGAAAVNQLETPRLTQAAQRTEFGVEGDMSAFRFSFSDPVRGPPSLVTFGVCSKRIRCRLSWQSCAQAWHRPHAYAFVTLALQYEPFELRTTVYI